MRQRRSNAAFAFAALAGASLLSLAGATSAEARQIKQQDSQTVEAQAQGAKASPAERKVCRLLPTSGTRMEKRVCMTREQWQEVERAEER